MLLCISVYKFLYNDMFLIFFDVCIGVKLLDCMLCVLSRVSHVRLFVTPWTVVPQTLSMGFSRQEY